MCSGEVGGQDPLQPEVSLDPGKAGNCARLELDKLLVGIAAEQDRGEPAQVRQMSHEHHRLPRRFDLGPSLARMIFRGQPCHLVDAAGW